MANDLTTLNSYLDTALRDPSNVTWTGTDKDAALVRAVRNLSPKITRPLNPDDFSIVLAEGTYYYPIDSEILHVSRIYLTEVDGTQHGALSDGTWETVGDLSTGSGYLHISPVIVDNHDLWEIYVLGYGRYDTTTNLIPDDYIELVISTAAAELIKNLLAGRAQFKQTGVTRQDQNVSVTELVTMLNAFEQSAREKRAATTTFRKPVPGRV